MKTLVLILLALVSFGTLQAASAKNHKTEQASSIASVHKTIKQHRASHGKLLTSTKKAKETRKSMADPGDIADAFEDIGGEIIGGILLVLLFAVYLGSLLAG